MKEGHSPMYMGVFFSSLHSFGDSEQGTNELAGINEPERNCVAPGFGSWLSSTIVRSSSQAQP